MEGKSNENQTNMLTEISADLGEVVIQHKQNKNKNKNDSGSSTSTYLQVAVERAAAGRKRYGLYAFRNEQ
jgi:hypothetical protein